MSEITSPARRLRRLLEGDDLVVAPGAFSPIVAKLVEESGFPVVYVTGAGIAAAIYGMPDTGLVTMTESVDAARNIAMLVDIPVICDADTGFGNAINVRRTVRELEMAGIAGLHIEDQVVPKKCGFFTGQVLVSIDEMCQRVHAALEARRDPDTVIIARTEALAAKDMDESIARAKAYVEAGADMIFVNGVTREEDARRIAAEVPGPKLYNVSTSGKTPHLHQDVIKQMGYRLVIYPAHTLFFALHEIRGLLANLKEAGTIAPWLDRMIDFDEWQRVTGVPEIEELEKRYASDRESRRIE